MSADAGFQRRVTPSGVHLFDRRTGLNVLLDEVTPPAHLWSEAPRFLSIALTNACDLSCPHCYAPKHGARLSSEEIARWADELAASGCLGLGLGGGEPTLLPWLPALCETILGRTKLAVTITTHGHTFDDALVDALTGRVNFIRVSMDGVGPTYERMRGRPFAAFEVALAKVAQTAPFGINFVVSRDTIADLPRTAEFAISRGARQLLLLPEVDQRGRTTWDAATREATSAWVAQHHRTIPIAISENGADELDAPQLDLRDPRGPSYDFMHIDADGRLKTCAFVTTGQSVAGSSALMAAVRRLREARVDRALPVLEEQP